MEHDLFLRLDAIDVSLAKILVAVTHSEVLMSAETDALAAQIAKTDGVVQSAAVMIGGFNQRLTDLAAQLAAQGVDNAAVLAMRDDLAANTQVLADAVAAVPPAPTPPAP
jgi:hypothetical protein